MFGQTVQAGADKECGAKPACGIDCGYFGNQLWFRSASMPQASVKTVMHGQLSRIGAPSQWCVFPFAVVTF